MSISKCDEHPECHRRVSSSPRPTQLLAKHVVELSKWPKWTNQIAAVRRRAFCRFPPVHDLLKRLPEYHNFKDEASNFRIVVGPPEFAPFSPGRRDELRHHRYMIRYESVSETTLRSTFVSLIARVRLIDKLPGETPELARRDRNVRAPELA
ncbi:hypothetical protein [Burkholderia vietnamiensis]|uniref:hypothetical protein n=1 Tax=Burkholderia vietnamiensis TaxID=60552 RepID=UPI0012D94FA3|nr:hypothetical protein [Burkholderia vietnamiensis]